MSDSTKPTYLQPWWKEPTKDQWYAYTAAWLGWTLDAFDFTVFLVLIVPIAKQFDAADLGGLGRDIDPMDASARSGRVRLDGRSDGTPRAVDDLHPLVLDL